MTALDRVASWDVAAVAVAVVAPTGIADARGELLHSFRIASVSKLLAGYAGLVAVEEGSLSLDEPAGRDGATVRHLLSHAAGYPFDGDAPITGVAKRRIYSNTGIEVFANHLEARTGIPFATYLHEAVLAPLVMRDTALRGSPAKDVWSTPTDMARFAAELLRPSLVAPETLSEAVRVQFDGLPGILPGVGRFDPCDWGLAFERNFAKPGHWAGTACSPASFGHFGGTGSFLVVEPSVDRVVVCLADREFDEWGMQTWPPFFDELVPELRSAA
jgi:CubicO group peptidase (beta-lactamase class C family)